MKQVPYLIAELGVNHDGDVDRAIAMTRECADAGFDAVKLQHWVPEELLAAVVPTAAYQGEGDQRDLLAPLLLSQDDLVAVREAAHAAGIDFGVTPDGVLALAQVLESSPDFVKIGSGDADNPWLLEEVASVPLPLVISTGMTSDEEVLAIAERLAGHRDVVFLHCVSAYPTRLRAADLARMGRLAELTGRPVGWSDHTEGVESSVAVTALGAVVIEKHVTYDAGAAGPDHHMSLPLSEAATWVAAVRDTAAAVAGSEREPAEASNKLVVRKALYPRRALPEGHVLAVEDLVPLRPLLDGVPALHRDQVVGRALLKPVRPEEPLRPTDLA